ncbi:hypothetical protein BH20BAC1_BH20BAC1_03370 [soil metagenome]
MLKNKICIIRDKLSFRIKWLLSILLITTFFPAAAQNESDKGLPFITNYLPRNYKALPQTWSIMEDNRGVMYFGVQNAILEYDGVKWRKVIFEHTPLITRSMAKDGKGKIYYGDVGDFGYLAMDSLGRTVAKSLLQYVPKEYRNFFDIWTIQVAREGIYFQSREYIFRLNEKNQVKVWKPRARFLYSFYVGNDFYVHEQGQGLFKMVNDSLQLIPGSEFLGQERMQVMLPYNFTGDNPPHEKQYLIGLFYSGLYLFDGKTFRPFNSEATHIFKISTLYKGAITQDGHYALSTTGKGLIVIDATGKIVRQINRDVGLQDESVYAVFADSKGTLWLALDNGISHVETASPLTQFTNQAGINTSALCIERFNGGLYLGTTNGLLKYNPYNSHFDRMPGIPSNQIFDFLRDENTLMVASDGLYGVVADKLINIQPSVGGNMALASLFISVKHPNVLYTGSASGVKIFTRTKTSWKYSGQVPKVDDQIWTLSENEDGTLWVGTQAGFVYRITPFFNVNGEPIPGKFRSERFGKEQGLQNGIGATYKIKGETWFPADSCIYRFDNKQSRFVKDTTFGNFKNGGGYQEFYMVEDKMGRVWVRFGKETVLATPQANGKYMLDTTSLLTISDQTVNSIYPEGNGIVWFCTTDGLVRFDEKVKKDYTASYKTVLRHITAGSEVLNPHAARSTTRRPELSYHHSNIRFEYAAPFFEQENKTQYQTWLEGFDDGWSGWDNNFYKEYTNLSPGKYKFHVRALNIYKKQSEEAVYEFIILSPWYTSWWAYILYVLLAILIIYALISWRTRALREKHTELEKTVEERTSQLRSRAEELAVINSVQEGLVREMDMQGIYNLVGNKIREIFQAQVLDIVTYDKNKNLIEDRYAYEKGDTTLLGPRKPHGLRKHIIETKQPLVINKDFKKINDQFDNEILIGEHPKSAVIVPMITAGEIVGMISLQDMDKENAFSESDVSLLSTLANSMSVALENARLFEETNRLLKEMKQRNGELSVINSVQEGLVAQMSMEGIYMLVGDRIRDLFDAQTVVIRIYDYENQLEHYKYTIEKGDRLYIESRSFDKFTHHLIHLRKPVLINDHFVEYISEFSEEANLQGEVPKSALFVPMILGETVIGNLSLQNVDHEDAFTDSDISLLSTLANSMSVALENARLFDETSRLLKETEQRSAELSVINSVQEGLAKELHMQGIYELVGDKLSEVMNTLDIDIRLFAPETSQVFYPYLRDHGELIEVPPTPMGGMSKLVYETRQTQVINENLAERMAEIGSYSIPGTQMEKSFMAVPILVGNNILGMVCMSNYEHENAFNDSDVRLLQTVVSAMSVALENARLFDETTRLLKETEQKSVELAVINSVQDDLVREMDVQRIYELVGNQICKIFDTQTVIIRTFNHKTSEEDWQYAIEKGEKFAVGSRPMIWANKKLIETRQPIFINENYEEIARQHGSKGFSKGMPPKSAIFVPMIVGDSVRGSVSLQNVEKENAFSSSDLSLLTTLTNSMSVALENARLFDETTYLLADAKQRATELGTVNSISKALASKLNIHELIVLVGDQLRDLFSANIVYLALLDPKTKIINFPYQFGDDMTPMKLGEGLTSQIILSGEPLLINKDVDKLSDELGLKPVGIPAASYLGVPIPVGDEIIGVLSVQSTELNNRFNENDQRLLFTIAASVGVAIRNAKLFEEVQQAKMEAESASKIAERANAAKSAFLSTVSHELRTPLTSVLGFAKIIRKRLEEKIFPQIDTSNEKTGKTVHQVSENLQVVISEGERLTHLINDVLDLAKIEAGKMEWNLDNVSMAEVAERAIAATTSLFEQKTLTLEKDIDDNLPEITGDRDKLIQVIINLFSNAVKFTGEGSVTCKIYQDNNELIVRISDTGIGIAPGDFHAVFEQFKQVGGDTLTDKPKGTGLGLPICKEIIEHHGGRIWLESEVNRGSTFSFALPVTKSEVVQHPLHLDVLIKQLKEQVAQSKINDIGKTANILVVDDDDSIRSLLHQELGEAGYIIEEAINGKQALDSVRKNRPDLIILDIMMPEMNGFDVAAILKNDPQTMDIPIIVLSIVQDKARGYRIGVDRYLTKPIDTHELFAEVGTLLEQGKSKKKVMVVDEDSTAVRSLIDVLQQKGYHVVESDGKELLEKAISNKPDIIILNSMVSDKQEIVKSLRFEKGLENVLFLIYQ